MQQESALSAWSTGRVATAELLAEALSSMQGPSPVHRGADAGGPRLHAGPGRGAGRVRGHAAGATGRGGAPRRQPRAGRGPGAPQLPVVPGARRPTLSLLARTGARAPWSRVPLRAATARSGFGAWPCGERCKDSRCGLLAHGAAAELLVRAHVRAPMRANVCTNHGLVQHCHTEACWCLVTRHE